MQNEPLVTNESIKFEKYPIQVQDFKKISTNRFRELFTIGLKLIRKH